MSALWKLNDGESCTSCEEWFSYAQLDGTGEGLFCPACLKAIEFETSEFHIRWCQHSLTSALLRREKPDVLIVEHKPAKPSGEQAISAQRENAAATRRMNKQRETATAVSRYNGRTVHRHTPSEDAKDKPFPDVPPELELPF